MQIFTVHPLTLRICPIYSRYNFNIECGTDPRISAYCTSSKSISNISGIDPRGGVWHVNSDLYCNFVMCYPDGRERWWLLRPWPLMEIHTLWFTREMRFTIGPHVCSTTVTSGDHLTCLFRFIKLLLLSFSKKILRPSKNQRNWIMNLAREIATWNN